MGHSVVLFKLRQFQDFGHKVVLIIGDYTALVGDPSGRNITRPQLSYNEVMENAKTYQEQVFKILDKNKTEVRFNGEWFSKMSFEDVIRIASKYTVARLLERDDFLKRYKEGNPIALHELLYPLMQGYDSVMIDADVELGGSDQLFNILVGRHLQREFKKEEQVALIMPLLVGTDGLKKMSKSYGNHIGIAELPEEIYGKVMSIPDDALLNFWQLSSRVDSNKINEIKNRLNSGENPRNIKRELARRIVEIYYDKESALKAERHFDRLFIQKEIPENIKEITLESSDLSLRIFELMVKIGFASSNSEAKRLINSKAVKIDGNLITSVETLVPFKKEGFILQTGKRNFCKITFKN